MIYHIDTDKVGAWIDECAAYAMQDDFFPEGFPMQDRIDEAICNVFNSYERRLAAFTACEFDPIDCSRNDTYQYLVTSIQEAIKERKA